MKNLLLCCIGCGLSIAAIAQTKDSLKNSFGLQYNYQHLAQALVPNWHIASLEYQRKAKKITMLGRLNYAERFSRTGWQAEVEAYPKLSKRTYAYLSAGYSPQAPVFPKWRGGVSLYTSLPNGWEAEGGVRYLYFQNSVVLGTAGLSKYTGPWLLNIRSFAAFGNSTHRPSVVGLARRYFKAQNDFAWVQVASGVSPDESRNVQLSGAGTLSSKQLLAGLRYTVFKNTAVILWGGCAREEWQKGRFGSRWQGTIGLQRFF